jgi:putative FmdB family regulatory protein
MPKYKYRCADCEFEFAVFHSIKQKLRNCEVCGVVGSLIRLPGAFVSNVGASSESAAGVVVKEKIEQFKEDLYKEKDKLRGREHD